MAMNKPTPKWRNVLDWSALGALLFILSLLVGMIGDEGGFGAEFDSEDLPYLGLALMLMMAGVGFSNQNRPFSLRRFCNFMILFAVAVIVFVLVEWGFKAFAGAGTLDAMAASERVAAGVGLLVLIGGLFGMVQQANAHMGGRFMDVGPAERLRENGRMYLYSYLYMAANGLVLILLGLAGPEGMLLPAAALTGALVLFVVMTVLGIAVWRLMDELMRTVSHETGNMSFYLIFLVGGGWALLAHLGFVIGPAPLDWLTMFTTISFAASFIAVGRRGLLIEPELTA